MAKYTTEVRFICEDAYGLTGDEERRPSINQITSSTKVRSRIFDFPYPIFDEAYRPVLEQKILKRYYTREIGEETFELWKLRLDTRLNEIMPYYNKLYASELIEFNPLYNTNYTREGGRAGEVLTQNSENRTVEEGAVTDNTQVRTPELTETRTPQLTETRTPQLTETRTPQLTDVRTLDLNDKTTRNLTTDFDGQTDTEYEREDRKTGGVWDLYSDTPQGGVAGIENAETDPSVANNGYLTNARHTFGDGNPDNIESTTGVTTDNTTRETGTSDLDRTGTDTLERTGLETVNKTGLETIDRTGLETIDKTGKETIKFDGRVDKTGSTDIGFDGTQNTTENYLEKVVGWNGSNPNKYLEDYRNNFLNIDLDIINRLQDLFMNIW